MRLTLAAVALMVAVGPGWAGQCIAHVHDGAPAFVQNGDIGSMQKVKRIGPYEHDDEVDHFDTVTPGGPWVWRVHSYIFRFRDVDLSGDCRSVRSNDLG